MAQKRAEETRDLPRVEPPEKRKDETRDARDLPRVEPPEKRKDDEEKRSDRKKRLG